MNCPRLGTHWKRLKRGFLKVMNDKVEEMEEKLDKLTDKKPVLIPLVVLENAMARAERREKHHFILFVTILICMIVSNLTWACYSINIERKEISSIMVEDNMSNMQNQIN